MGQALAAAAAVQLQHTAQAGSVHHHLDICDLACD